MAERKAHRPTAEGGPDTLTVGSTTSADSHGGCGRSGSRPPLASNARSRGGGGGTSAGPPRAASRLSPGSMRACFRVQLSDQYCTCGVRLRVIIAARNVSLPAIFDRRSSTNRSVCALQVSGYFLPKITWWMHRCAVISIGIRCRYARVSTRKVFARLCQKLPNELGADISCGLLTFAAHKRPARL